MSSNYSGNPQSVPKDAVRFLVQDTGPTFLFSDEEILFALSTQANLYMAAALLCDTQLAKIANSSTSSGALTSKTIGSWSESYAPGISKEFLESRSKELKNLGRGHQIPWQEAISQKFSFRQFDNPEVVNPGLRDDQSPLIESDELS